MTDLVGTALSVLMIGHSLFGQTGPEILATSLQARAPAAQVQAQIINGAPLIYNWEHSAEAEGVDARAVLPTGQITDLVLTEALPLANHLEWSETGAYALAFAGLALEANPQTRIFVQETWHSLNSGTGQAVAHDDGADQPWRARLDDDLPKWEGIVAEMQRGAPEAAERFALIPAGQAMGRLADEIAAGRVGELGDIAQLFEDDIHLNAVGHYFVAMVQVAVLTEQDPAGLPHSMKDRWGGNLEGPDGALAAELQRVAWDAVREYRGEEVASLPVAPIAPVAAKTLVSAPRARAEAPMQMAIGLAPVTDWSTQQPFLDLMKTARPWFGHLAGQWGGVENDDLQAAGYLDADGWVLDLPPEVGSVGTLVLTNIPQTATSLVGRYVLRFEGKGIVEATGRASNQRYGKGEVSFDYAPGDGSVDIRIQRMSKSDPIRNITLVRADRVDLFEAGAIFNPDWTGRLERFDSFRFMDWMATNDSIQSTWDARPRLEETTWAAKGTPVEVMVALANETGTDPWFNMPHLADDAYVEAFATYVKGALDPKLKAYVEYSNEVWNWQFEQAVWTDEQARARWNQDDVGTQFYGMRAAQIARIWSDVYGPVADARLVNVISSQTGWLGLEGGILEAPLVVAEGSPPPAEAFDAYAITGYFGGILGHDDRAELVDGWLTESLKRAENLADANGLTGQARNDKIAATRFDYATMQAGAELNDGRVSGNNQDSIADLVERVWPYHAQVAQTHGLDLIMYEGGTHVVGLGPMLDNEALTAFFHHLNYAPEMGVLYEALLAGWRDVGGDLFNAYADVYAPTKWGSWGGLRFLTDSNPRWDVLVNFE
ncbi:hypothetical protein C1J03_07755 [Sulfitobacter sp. SK012]|uniref:hypothetical protein n=1 Tax=Sulfitobacter sp. SK012 TaxID=1389005 RepID=UPI000E0A2646|nr:hypothetical protein [Sulfitobacter sp. SK012]AXI45926.1 hypothetical protein C1J03_07755 [Sulfitobacter sp. SK012]